jgi:hypothetical protein
VSQRGARVIDGELHRVRHGRRKRFVAVSSAGPEHRPARVAVTLAFAHKIRQAILRGEIQNQAEAARRVGLTRARLSQILHLTNLAPDLQEEILFLETIDGREPLRERALRGVVRVTTWAEQRSTRRADSSFPRNPSSVHGYFQGDVNFEGDERNARRAAEAEALTL